MSEPIKGFKVFEPDWTCKGKQYTCPGKFEEDVIPSVCNKGIHFCRKLIDCFSYYLFEPSVHVAEVIAYGKVDEDGYKCCTDKIEILREVPWCEVLDMVNTGRHCVGRGNSGHYNSGFRNSGNGNSGYYNSGYGNIGSRNSGNYNSGYSNSGNYNSGNRNSGDWNNSSFSNGCFNTIEPKIYLFNKPSACTFSDWRNSAACKLLRQIPKTLEFMHFDKMTDAEKLEHPEAETTGGYLKEFDITDRRNEWWRRLSDSDKDVITSIPNFDKDIFKEITGIDIDG